MILHVNPLQGRKSEISSFIHILLINKFEAFIGISMVCKSFDNACFKLENSIVYR